MIEQIKGVIGFYIYKVFSRFIFCYNSSVILFRFFKTILKSGVIGLYIYNR